MATLFRWLLRLTVGAILLGLAGFVLTWWFFARSLPDYDARTRVAGITAPVEIVRDHANVPHVFGRTDRDVFFALGYAHAQDRLWQMTMLRRTVQGRLSELFGQRTAESDVLMRRLDLYRAATASVEDQDGQTRTALDAYAAGVNAWVGEVNTGARGRGAPEMWLFNQPISPWQPADSVAILKLMAWQQSDHLQAEVLRARSSLVLEEDRLRDILPDVPGPGLTALPRYADLMPEIPQRFAAMDPDAPFDPLSASLPATLSGASNAWAAGPSRSAAGATLLANDPHRLLTAPSIWYLARLELTSGGVIGATIPGIPLVLAGRSADLGWGITASFADDLDLYAEEVNPKNAAEYRTPEGWERFEARDSIVEIKDAAAVTLRLRRTANGPVLPPEQFALDTIRPRGHVMTLAWSGLSGDDTSMTAGLRLMQARSIEEAMRAGRLQVDALGALEDLGHRQAGDRLADQVGGIVVQLTREVLHLHVHAHPLAGLQRLGQVQRVGGSVAGHDLAHRATIGVMGVVVDHQDAIGREPDVQLHPVGTLEPGLGECRLRCWWIRFR